MSFRIAAAIVLTMIRPLAAQLDPDGAHVNLYLPQVIDGGPTNQRWQTELSFVNPHAESAATAVVRLLGHDGGPLSLDFGSGPAKEMRFTVPPLGFRRFTSTGNSPAVTGGWAIAAASTPLKAAVSIRVSVNGVVAAETGFGAVLPAPAHLFAAQRGTILALSNVLADVPVTVGVVAIDAEGRRAGSRAVAVPPQGHQFVSLGDLLPSLASSFSGSVMLESSVPQRYFVAAAIGAGTALAAQPPGGLAWPVSHYDRIWQVYRKVLNANRKLFAEVVDLESPPVDLEIGAEPEINAFAAGGRVVRINLALSELISDSPSELAFVAAHELAHIVQQRIGRTVLGGENAELDADRVGMLVALAAGFDPYGAAGALAKLQMAHGTAGLGEQLIADFADEHRSFNTRIASMSDLLGEMCANERAASLCRDYRSLIHPHFPPTVPLDPVPAPAAGNFKLSIAPAAEAPSGGG